MIEDFFTKTLTHWRQVWSEGEDEEEGIHSSELTEIDPITGHLQNITAELAANLGLSLTKSFVLWCDVDADIDEGDVLKDGDVGYTVHSFKELNIIGADNKHLQIFLQRQ